jgi:tetratricopeptide (TPR) repeat protein
MAFRGFLILLCLLASALFTVPARADISVRASLNPQRAQVGEPLTLAIEISGAQNVAAPAVTADGFDVQYVGPSTQISIVNANVSSSVQHRYSLLPLRAGHFTLGPFTVEYQGKTYQTASFNVDVTASAQSPQGQVPQAQAPQGQARPAPPSTGQSGVTQPGTAAARALRLTVSVPQQDVYLHERVPLDVTLYVGSIRVANLQYPTLAADGLSVDKFPEPSQRQQVIDGETYQVVHFQTAVVPLRAGTLTIGPASLQLNVLTQRRNSLFNDPFFQHFFQDDPFSTERRRMELHSDPITLNVLPLPEEGKPAGFSGAVGRFTLQVSAAPTEVTAGDPITLRMMLNGSGNLAEATPPELMNTDGFRAYETHPGKSEDGGPGSTTIAKSFEQVLIPNDAHVRAVPAVHFSYFDPQTRRYETARTDPIALVVRPPQNAARQEVFAAGTPGQRIAPEEKLGHDIVYIKDDPGTLSVRSEHWYGSPFFWLWQPVPLLLFVAAAWYDRRRQRLTGDVRYARFSRAGRQARQGLAVAEKALAKGEATAFYDAVSRTMQEYLAAKLDLPPGAIDADAVARRGVPADSLQHIGQFFATCEQIRFAPTSSDGDMRGVLTLAQQIVRRLERLRKLAPSAQTRAAASRFEAVVRVLLILGMLSGAARAAELAEPSPRTTFYHANALYKDAQYAAAAKEYETLSESGLTSGNLYFNLGNAYFKAGEKGKAILNYERARRLIPGDPDLNANLAYAQSLTEADACSPALWQVVVFPLSHRVATRRLVCATSALYTLLLLVLAGYRLWPVRPRWLVYAATGLAVLVLISSTSLAQQVLTDDWQPQAVVISSGEAPTRFEPAENGTVHFVLKEGSLVRVVETRDSWIEVARCDGRRGWIEKSAIEEL